VVPLKRSELWAVVIAGITAGTVDIGAASLIYGASPITILHAIAAGLLGRRSFSLGVFSGALGLILQWAMSCIIAAIYILAARRLLVLKRRWAASGLLYGLIVFGVMNYVVLPLSAVGKSPSFTIAKFIENLVAMFLFGLIITYVDRRRSLSLANDPS
jgi:hypothetical protein